jgi:hypothetical protein
MVPVKLLQSPLGKGRHMARDRHQDGWVEETGKRTKKWKGHYFVYVRKEDGTEKRVHKGPILGLKAEMKKWEAERELQKVIEKETGGNAPARPDDTVTFEWFWQNRFLPLNQGKWRLSTNDTVLSVMRHHV